MARIVTSAIESFAPVSAPTKQVQPGVRGEDKAAKLLGLGEALAANPLVGLAGYGLETIGRTLADKYAESSAVSDAEAKWAQDQAKKAQATARDQSASTRRNLEAGRYREGLQAKGGVGAQVEQLARDRAELERLALDNPDLMAPTASGGAGPLAQKFNNLVREEARLRFGLRKEGAEAEPAGIRAPGTEERAFQTLSRTGRMYEVPTKAHGQTLFDRPILGGGLEEEQLLADKASWMQRLADIDPNAPDAKAAFARAAGKVDQVNKLLGKYYPTRGLDQSDADRQALMALRAKWQEINAKVARPDDTLKAVGQMPVDKQAPAAVAPAAAGPTPGVASAPAPTGAAPVRYAPPATGTMVGGATVTGPVTEGTRQLTQRAGERSEELRREIDDAVDSLQAGLQSAGLSGDEALKRAQDAVAAARASAEADNKKFMDATERFALKEPVVEIDETTGKGRVVRSPEAVSVKTLVQLARLADTKEKQARIYELAANVNLPWGSLADRFGPGRHTRFAQELEKIFPTSRKGLLDEAADLAYKFARVQGVGAGITKGQQQVVLGATGKKIQAAGAQAKLDEGQVERSLDIDRETGKAVRAEESLQAQLANAAAGRALSAGIAAAGREAARAGRGPGEAEKETDPIVEAARVTAVAANAEASENRRVAKKAVSNPALLDKGRTPEEKRKYAEAKAEWDAVQKAKEDQVLLDRAAADAKRALQDALKAQAEAVRARSTTSGGGKTPPPAPAPSGPATRTLPDGSVYEVDDKGNPTRRVK